jgi:hypothetical protein
MITLGRIHKLIVVIGFIQAAILLVDGGVYMLTGSYLSNQIAALLISRASWLLPWFNPWRWTLIFVNQGIDVRMRRVVYLFFITAGLWIVASLIYGFRPNQTWWWLILMSLLGFWYVPVGVWLGVVEIVLLSSYRLMAAQN